MQTQKEQWLSFVELGRMFSLQAARVSQLATRHNLEVKSDPIDKRKKLVKLSDFKRIIE